MIAGCSVAEGTGSFVAVAVVVTGAEVAESFGGTFLADFVDHHPSPLLHFCKWGNAVLISIFLWLVWAFSWCGGIAAILGCSVLMVEVGVGTGVVGIDQSFLVSNRISEADPALGQGVPCLIGALGISSSGGRMSFRDLGVGHGTSANCPTASLCIVTGRDSAVDLTIAVCVLTVTTVVAGAVAVGVEGIGWVITLTLYLLLAIMFFLLLSVTFILGPGDFLALGFVLGWAGLSWFGCIQVCCSWVLDWAWTWDQVSLPVLGIFSSFG